MGGKHWMGVLSLGRSCVLHRQVGGAGQVLNALRTLRGRVDPALMVRVSRVRRFAGAGL